MGGTNLIHADSYAKTPRCPLRTLHLPVGNLAATAGLRASPGPILVRNMLELLLWAHRRFKSNIHPLSSCIKEGNRKHNNNQNLGVHIPTVASISSFIRNAENCLGNPMPTGTTVKKKKTTNGHTEPPLLTTVSTTKTLHSRRVLLGWHRTHFNSSTESLALLIY